MPTTTTLPAGSSHFIDLNTAIDMTTRYRANRESVLDSTKRGQDILPLSETFNRDAIDAMLAVTGCAGIRIYPGMDEELQVHAIMVPVDEYNQDILPQSLQVLASSEDPIIEVGQRCPTLCPPASDLNS